MIYSAGSISLAVLEILANYSVLPLNYSFTSIMIPDGDVIEHVIDLALPRHWDATVPGKETQRLGDRWVKEHRSAVLSVPSSVIPSERNFVINPAHPDFRKIEFSDSQPFLFDPRLR